MIIYEAGAGNVIAYILSAVVIGYILYNFIMAKKRGAPIALGNQLDRFQVPWNNIFQTSNLPRLNKVLKKQ